MSKKLLILLAHNEYIILENKDQTTVRKFKILVVRLSKKHLCPRKRSDPAKLIARSGLVGRDKKNRLDRRRRRRGRIENKKNEKSNRETRAAWMLKSALERAGIIFSRVCDLWFLFFLLSGANFIWQLKRVCTFFF